MRHIGNASTLPASVIERVDLDSQTVYVDHTKDEIKVLRPSSTRTCTATRGTARSSAPTTTSDVDR